MPKTEPIHDNEKQTIEHGIKREIAGAGSNVSDTARRLNEKFGSSELPANLLRQISSGTIPFWKVLRIADVLGYELIWKKREG